MQQEKIRLYTLARELNLDARVLLDVCRQAGMDVKTPLSMLDYHQRRLIEQHLAGQVAPVQEDAPVAASVPSISTADISAGPAVDVPLTPDPVVVVSHSEEPLHETTSTESESMNTTITKTRTQKPAPAQGERNGHSPRPGATANGTDTHLSQLHALPLEQLVQLARTEGVADAAVLAKPQLVTALAQLRARRGHTVRAEGTLEVLPENFGFLRRSEDNYLSTPQDIYVSPTQIRKFGLQTGMIVQGTVRPPLENQQSFALMQVERVNGQSPEQIVTRVRFEDLTPLHPTQRLLLETAPDQLSMRVVDLVTPIGKGQRGLIVAPPRTGKTVLLQQMARSIMRNHPESYVIVLLIDERPEEVTEMRRAVAGPSAEVVASTFDSPGTEHTRVAELVLEKAKRMVESGRDVVILLDSITRLARAYNTQAPDNGRTLTGGLTAGALEKPKRFFGAARHLEEAGSLTILATALVDTGSRMDEVIFEEFKGTGNMELHLERRLVDKRIWPAIDVNASGTRREELLLSPEDLRRVWMLRKVLSEMNPAEAMELLLGRLRRHRSNNEFLKSLGA
jgi:transcription termination factor Rho